MKRFVTTFISLALLGLVVYVFQPEVRKNVLPFWDRITGQIFTPAPCTEPIPYTLNTFDTKFKISKEYFLSALTDAEKIWEKRQGDYSGKDLFVYAPEDTTADVLKVNLIYDYRQEATSKLSSLGIVVSDNRASYDELKTKFTTMKANYDKAKADFSTQVTDFNQRQKSYEDSVNSWNAKGGAPQREFNKLEVIRVALNAESKDLQAKQDNINGMTDEINALVVVLNRLVASLNLSVDKYNTVNVARGESFEEGIYQSDGSSREIDIYEFSNREKLVRVLAHELGHALGLDHVEDPKAIMYKINQASSLALTQADISALKTKCGLK